MVVGYKKCDACGGTRSSHHRFMVCRQLDALNLLADEPIARAEADIRNSPLTAYRLGKAKR